MKDFHNRVINYLQLREKRKKEINKRWNFNKKYVSAMRLPHAFTSLSKDTIN